jgi:hypothetical protein
LLTRVELFERIRGDRRADPSVSGRVLARRHGVSRRTVKAALASAVPPPRKPPVRSRQLVLTPVKAIVDEMLRSDPVRTAQAAAHDRADLPAPGHRARLHRRVLLGGAQLRGPPAPEILAEARAGHQHLQGMVSQSMHPAKRPRSTSAMRSR